jgi:hypothetical protein
MILTIPMDENTTGCIAWGKITVGRGTALSEVNPVKRMVYDSGIERLMFFMNVNVRKTNQPGSRDGMLFENASVTIYVREGDQSAQKLADVVRKLRRSDPVLVVGKYVPPKDEAPKNRFVSHQIEAFAVIPLAWTYDVLNELFEQIIAQTEPPKLPKYRKGQKVERPKTEPVPQKQTEEVQQITHPVVMGKDGMWFE